MARAKKTLKGVKKSRASTLSPGLRAIEKLHHAIQQDQEKLVKRYEKSVRMTEKDVARITSQLEKLRKTRASGRPGRGRKPAKNALQVLQAALQTAQTELTQLILGHKKMLAEKKALMAFEKEWKKTAASVMKAKKVMKKAKVVKAAKVAKPAKTKKTRKAASPKVTPLTEKSHGMMEHMHAGEHEIEMAE